MPTFNRNFQMSLNDIDLIEEALRARGRELSMMRLSVAGETPEDIKAVRVIEQDQRNCEELLGRMHDQKIFYRPKTEAYIGG